MKQKTVTIKSLECKADESFIEVGKYYPVTGEIKDRSGDLVGYRISTPRNKWLVSLDQIEKPCNKN